MVDVVSMGEYLVDCVAVDRNVPLSSGPAFVMAPGGAPANVAVGLQRLGLQTRFIGKVGNDAFGEYLRGNLSPTGVDTSCLLTDADARTTMVFVGVWDDGRKDMCFYRNPGADIMLRPDEITEDMFEGARCFHFGSIGFINEPCASAQRKAIEIAKSRGMMISYDPNYRPTLWPSVEMAEEVIQDSFKYCHLAKISEEEWEIATGCRDVGRGVEAVLEKGVELLVVSHGEHGAFATNGCYEIRVPAWDVDIVETTGAGDGFLAGVISKLLPEREKYGSLKDVPREMVEEALRFGTAVGALACMKNGVIPALPTRDEVERFIGTR